MVPSVLETATQTHLNVDEAFQNVTESGDTHIYLEDAPIEAEDIYTPDLQEALIDCSVVEQPVDLFALVNSAPTSMQMTTEMSELEYKDDQSGPFSISTSTRIPSVTVRMARVESYNFVDTAQNIWTIRIDPEQSLTPWLAVAMDMIDFNVRDGNIRVNTTVTQLDRLHFILQGGIWGNRLMCNLGVSWMWASAHTRNIQHCCGQVILQACKMSYVKL